MTFFSAALSAARSLAVGAIAVLIFQCNLAAQIPASSSTTSTPVPGAGHDYLGDLAETVNPATGSVSIRIGVQMPPGRGISLPFSFAYDSNGVNYVGNNSSGVLQWLNPSTTIVSGGGWSNTVPVVSLNELTWTGVSSEGHREPCWAFVNYVYQDAHGDRHDLNLSTYNQAGIPSGTCTYDSSDWPITFDGEVVRQSGEARPGAIIASIPSNAAFQPGPVSVVDADGTSFYFPNVAQDGQGTLATSVEDRNGNIVTINPPVYPSPSYNYVDTAGRKVLQDTGFGVNPETVTVAALGGPYSLEWTQLSTPLFSVPVTTVKGNACTFGGQHQSWGQQTSGGLGHFGQNAISTLTLPNGKSFTFTYDPTYMLISKMIYPTGGYVRYVWGVNNEAEIGSNTTSQVNEQCTALYGMPAVTDRYVSFDGSTEVLHQHFQYSTVWDLANFKWTSKQTTVTTSDLVRGTTNTTVYTYSPLYADQPPNAGSPTPYDPVEASIQYDDFTGAPLKTVTKTWINPRLLSTETVTYPTGQASETKWTYDGREQEIVKDEYDYGSKGVGSLLRKTVTNYQHFDLNLYPNAAKIADKPCQVIIYDGAGKKVAETDSFYDNGATGTPCGAAGIPVVGAVTGLTGHDGTGYSATSKTARGNLTQKKQILNTGPSPVTTYTYDEAGQTTSIKDPNGNTIEYSYADNYQSGSGEPPSQTDAYLTTITYPTVKKVTQHNFFQYAYSDGQLTESQDDNEKASGVAHSYAYDDSLRRLTESKYPDGGQTSNVYDDSPPEPSITTCQRIGGSAGATCSAASPSSGWKVTVAEMDGKGHVIQTQTPSDPDGNDLVDTGYDGMGQVYTKSNPYRSGSPSTTDGTTTYTYDAIGRITNVAQPDGSTVATSYGGNQTTVTDEAGNKSTSQVDALARVTDVFEAPNVTGFNYWSHYQYDALDNLVCAVQKGTKTTAFSSCASVPAAWRPRAFVYDSLSRLTQAKNPESGTIAYTYDANGNVLTKKARSPNRLSTGTATVTTKYTYDALNRLTGKSFIDTDTSNPPTAAVVYGYDGAAISGCPGDKPPGDTDSNPVGRRTSMCDGSGAANWTHDPMGRIKQEKRDIASVVNEVDADVYNYDGSVASVTSLGFETSYTYNDAGRPISATGGSVNFIQSNSAKYAPFGSLTSAKMGSQSHPLVITNAYNDRLQPLLLSAAGTSPIMSVCYDFNLVQVPQNNTTPCKPPAWSGDNGNVRLIINNLDPSRSRGFGYDPLNRITAAGSNGEPGTSGGTPAQIAANCWGYLYNYDAWGNLLEQADWTKYYGSCKQTKFPGGSAEVNNHLSELTYDAAGNVTQGADDTVYIYDAENRLIAIPKVHISYVYDGDGKRIEKCTESSPGKCASGATGTLYWRAWGDDPLAETDLAGNILENYVFFNGKRIARRDHSNGAVHFYFSDSLGSHAVVTDIDGTCEQDIDYYPFGGARTDHCGTVPQHYKFTGKERDAESGLDNFGARYYGSSLGRFMTPDWAAKPISVPYAEFGDPQTLNLYAYVRNNPLSKADADGHSDAGTFCNTQCRYGTPVSNTEIQIDIGILELSSAVATGGATAEAMEAGAALKTATTLLTTIGLAVSGSTRIIATASGVNSEDVEKGTTAVTTLTTPVGLAVTVGSGFNMKAGAIASDLSSAKTILTKPAEAAKDPAGTALTLNGVVQDVKEGIGAVKSLLSSPAPPPPPPPPRPPTCDDKGQCH